MDYNFEERINRVINNHQFTCQHTSHYLFILKGFEPLLNNIELNVKGYSKTLLSNHDNLWITYEDAYILNENEWDQVKENNYDIWVVDFNFFDQSHIALTRSSSHEIISKDDDVIWVNYKEIKSLTRFKTLNIFNGVNPLIGVVSDPKDSWNNTKRFNLLKNSTIK